MTTVRRIKLFLFVIFSAIIWGCFFYRCYIPEKSIELTVSGGSATLFEHYSRDFKYRQTAEYPGSPDFVTVRFPLDKEETPEGSRFDFGYHSGALYLIRSIVYTPPGFKRYVLDLNEHKKWIKKYNHLQLPRMLEGNLLLETTGNDAFIGTSPNAFSVFSSVKFNFVPTAFYTAAAAEVLLLLLLLFAPRLYRRMKILLLTYMNRKICLKTAYVVAANVVLWSVLYGLWIQNRPDQLRISLRSDKADVLEIYSKPANEKNYKEKGKIAVKHPGGDQWYTFTAVLPEKHSSDDLRIDFGTIPKHVEIRDLTLIRNGLFAYTLSLDKAAKIYSRRRQIQRFDARPGCMVLQTSGNDGYIVADPELFSSSLKFSAISWGLLFAVPVAAVLIWFALSDLCIAWISGIVRCAAEKTLGFWKRVLASERNRAILKKAGIFAGVDLVLILPLFFFVCKSSPDEFHATLETKTPEELSLYLKTPSNPEFSEKVRLRKEVPAGKITTWKQQLPDGTQIDSFRFDLGTKPEKMILREVALLRYGFLKQTPDLAQAEKIFIKHRVTRFAVKDGVVTLSSNYNPYLISLKKEFTKSLENSFVFTGIAVWFLLSQLLLLFLLSPYGIGVWRQLCQYHLWEKVKSQRRLLRQAGIFAGVDLVLILPLFFFVCKSLPDEFLITLETQTPEELSLYLKTPDNPEFSEKVRLRKEVPAGKITTWKQQLPDGTQIDSFRFDLGTKPEKIILREVALLRYGFLKQTPDLAQAEKIFSKHRVTRFAVKDGVVTLSSNYNPYLVARKKEFAQSLENSFVFTGIAVWFLLSQLLLLFLLSPYGIGVWRQLCQYHLWEKVKSQRRLLRKAGIFAGVDLVLVLPLFFFICKSLPDEFLITLETKTPEELSLYLKTADNPEFSEKVRLKKDIPAGKIITWKQQLPEGTQIDNIRLDLGTKPEKITIREIALQRYGFLKQTPDLAQAQKIFSKHRVTRFAVKDGVVTLSSNYNPYLISLKKEFTKSLENSFVFTGIAVWFLLSQLLLLFLLSPYGIGVWRQLCQYHLWEKVKSQRRLLRKAGIFAGVDLVLILPLFFFICKSLPDEFLLTLETQTPEELSLYLKTPSNPEFSEKVRLRKEVPAGKITTWKQQLPEGTQIDSFRFDLGTKPEKVTIREIALLRYGFLKQTPDLAQAEKIFSKHRVTRFAVKDGVVTLSSNYNPYLISLKKEFAKSLENSFVFTGIAVWFLLSQLLLLLLFRYGRELLLVLKTFDLSAQIRKHRKLLKNTAFFVGLNIIILGMVWSFLIPELPDFFSISLASNKADAVELFIQTADDRSYSENNKLLISHSGNNKKDTCTVRLPAGVLTGNIRIDFGSIPKELRIRDISVYTNGVFRQRLDLSKAVDVYTIKHHIKTFEYDGQEIFIRTENNDPFIIPNAKSFAVAMVSDGISSVACGVWAVFEICLLLLIVFGPELWKKNCFAPRENLLQSTVCALCFSALIMLLIPVYTLRSNHENFACSVTELLLANLPEFFLLFFVLTAVLFLLRRILNYVPHMLMLGITVYIFLETGLLSIGLPALNGDLSGYGIISRSVWDTAVLLLLLLLPCIFVKTLKQWSHWICLIVLVMSLLSCIEAKKSVCQDHGDMIIKEMLLRRNVIDSVRYSAQKNVMMFILDSISTEVLEEVLQKNPDIAALFPGFVCYRDNIGMHQQTSVALPGIMTGKYCEDFGKLASYTLSTYGKESFLKDYLEADVPVYVNLGISDVASYTNRLSAVGGKDKDIGSIDPMQQRIPGMLVWSLKEICWFRMTPYILKKTVLARIIAGWKQNYFSENLANDEVLCRHLLQKLPDAKEPLVLNVHHTNGSHLPFIFGPNGEMRAQSDATWQGYYEQSCYILKLLGGLLSHYQKLGIYDKATIIVCADHGLFSPRKQNTRLPQVPGTAFPFLMIKPAARTASLQFSDLPVSHNKIAMLVRKLYKQDLSQQEVEETLKSSQRLYRQFSGTQNMDYIIDDKGGFQKVVRNAEQRDASEFAPLVLNKKYSLKIFGNTEYPDFFCQNMVRTGGNGLDILSTIGEIKLKAPAPDRKYVVEFSAFTFVVSKQHYKGKYMFRDMIRKDAPRITADKAVPFRNARVCIPVVSDSKGVIRLQVDGRDTNYFLGLEHLILSEQGAQQ